MSCIPLDLFHSRLIIARPAQAEAALVTANLGNARAVPSTSQNERPYISWKRQKSASNETSLDMNDLPFGKNAFSHDATWRETDRLFRNSLTPRMLTSFRCLGSQA